MSSYYDDMIKAWDFAFLLDESENIPILVDYYKDYKNHKEDYISEQVTIEDLKKKYIGCAVTSMHIETFYSKPILHLQIVKIP